MNNFITSEAKEVFSIFKRIKNRDFRGNSGAAIRNSTYQIATTFVSKAGSLLFTIILARILMPELFGLYSLALFTILLFSFFSDLGVGTTMIRFMSKSLFKNNFSKAKAYFLYTFRIKFLFISGILALFLVLSKPLSWYYQKPIFIILLSGSLYLFSTSLVSFIQGFFHSLNDFKTTFARETISQILRLVIIPLFVLYLLSKSFSGEIIIILIFILLGFIWALMTLFLFFSARKTKLFSKDEAKLKIKEKKEVKLFLFSILAFSVFSLIFTYSDMFILGGFVDSEYIGYYQVAISLIGSLSTLVLFSGSLFPVFSRLNKDALESGFKKSLRLTIFISLALLIGSLFFSKMIVTLLYGIAYSQAIPFFRGLCLLLLLWPLTALYNGYFMAKGKPEVIRNLLILTASFNLIIGFSLAYLLSSYNQSLIVFGVIFSMVFSNLIYLIGCIWKKKRK